MGRVQREGVSIDIEIVTEYVIVFLLGGFEIIPEHVLDGFIEHLRILAQECEEIDIRRRVWSGFQDIRKIRIVHILILDDHIVHFGALLIEVLLQDLLRAIIIQIIRIRDIDPEEVGVHDLRILPLRTYEIDVPIAIGREGWCGYRLELCSELFIRR